MEKYIHSSGLKSTVGISWEGKLIPETKGRQAYIQQKKLKEGEEKDRVRSAGPVGMSAQYKK